MSNILSLTILSLVLLASSGLSAKTSANDFFSDDAQIYNVKNCFRKPFDSYESWMTMMKKHTQKRAKTEEEADERIERFKANFPEDTFNEYNASLVCISFNYKVGSEEVGGYLIRPKHHRKLPIIFYNRGGNGNYGGMVFGAIMHRLMPLAKNGFVVVGSQYRGTFQKGGLFKDEFGGADVEDVVTLVKALKYLKNAENKNIGMLGSSRGAMQTLLALKELDNLISKVVLQAGNYDLLKDLNVRPEMELVYEKRIPHYKTQKYSQLRKRSALYWSSEIETSIPILLQHGDDDSKVNVFNSEALAQQFKATHRRYKLSVYKNSDHGFSGHETKVFNEMIDWFQTELK